MFMVVITQTTLFARKYQEWHTQLAAAKSLTNAFTWWVEKARITKKYDKIAGSMGRGNEYGMQAESKPEEDRVFEDYALSMQLSNQNLKLQQALQQQQQAINQLQQQAMCAQTTNIWNNNNNNNRNNGGNHHNNNFISEGRDNQKYCWSHGWCNHTGKDCTRPCVGHQQHAHTRARKHRRQPQEQKEVKLVQVATEQQRRRPKHISHAYLASQRSNAAGPAAACLPQHPSVPAHAGAGTNVCARQRNGAPAGAGVATFCQLGKLQ